MAFLWSNPTPSDDTAAKLQSRFEVQAPSIGSLVAAILSAREAKSKADQQSMNDLIKGIGSAAGGVAKGYAMNQAQGQSDDAANAAIYRTQYPNDPYGAFTDPGRVPDYGGVESWQALEHSQGSQPPQTYTDPNTGAQFFHGPRGWQAVHGSSGGSSNNGSPSNGKIYDEQLGGYVTPAQSFNAERSRLAEIRKQLSEQSNEFGNYGAEPNDFMRPAAHGYVQGDKGKLQYAGEGQEPTLISPKGDAMQGATSMTPELYHQLQDKAQHYKQLQDDASKRSQELSGPTPSNTPANSGQGDMVRVVAPDGRTGSIPRANLQDAISVGYKPL